METQPEKPQSKQPQAELIVKEKNLFSSADLFNHAQRVAGMLSKSDLTPKQFKDNVANCLIALEMANRIGASPLMVMQNLYIVHGKPAWSSTFLIATVNGCGKFSPLRYEEDAVDGGRTRAWAIDKSNNEKIYGVWVSMKMAKEEGWLDKAGSKWKTMPELMRRYRASAFFARQFAPELSMGIHTQEEVIDTPYLEVTTEEDYEQLCELFEMKRDALEADEIADAERIIKNRETKAYRKLHKYLSEK